MNSYELSARFFDWSFENPDKVNPNHIALYFFIIEHCNRLGWKDKFGLPTEMTKEAIGIKSYKTYQKTLNDLIEFGFISMVTKSKNQYSSNIIALVKNTKPRNKARTKALLNHMPKQVESKESIDKPINQEPINRLSNNDAFDVFWDKYPVKVAKQKAMVLFCALQLNDVTAILNSIDAYAAYKPFATYTHPNPTTYLNQRRWEDVIPQQTEVVKPTNQITYDVWHIAKQVPAEMERICKATGLTNEQFLNLYVGK